MELGAMLFHGFTAISLIVNGMLPTVELHRLQDL